MAFVLAALAPGIERVIDDEPMTEHLVVIEKSGGEAEGDGVEPGRLRCQVESGGIRAAHNHGEAPERLVPEIVFLEERIETALIAHVG